MNSIHAKKSKKVSHSLLFNSECLEIIQVPISITVFCSYEIQKYNNDSLITVQVHGYSIIAAAVLRERLCQIINEPFHLFIQ